MHSAGKGKAGAASERASEPVTKRGKASGGTPPLPARCCLPCDGVHQPCPVGCARCLPACLFAWLAGSLPQLWPDRSPPPDRAHKSRRGAPLPHLASPPPTPALRQRRPRPRPMGSRRARGQPMGSPSVSGSPPPLSSPTGEAFLCVLRLGGRESRWRGGEARRRSGVAPGRSGRPGCAFAHVGPNEGRAGPGCVCVCLPWGCLR